MSTDKPQAERRYGDEVIRGKRNLKRRVLCDLFGTVKTWPSKWLSDLQSSGMKRSRLESPGGRWWIFLGFGGGLPPISGTMFLDLLLLKVGKNQKNIPQMMVSLMVLNPMVESVKAPKKSSWWFQPLWKILYSKIGNLPQVGDENKKYLKHLKN